MDITRPVLQMRARLTGFSLIELMVALAIGLCLVGAMLVLLLTSIATGKTRDRASDLQNNGRYALDTMKRDVRHAGFYGYTGIIPDTAVSFAVTNVCDADFVGRLTRRVWAEDDTNPYNNSCIPANQYMQDTDVLVVRHLSPSLVLRFQPDRIYVRSAYEGAQAFLGSAGAPDFKAKLWTDPVDHALEETVYFISRWTASQNESPRIPALYRMKLGNGPAMVPELVATGIENLQVRVQERTSTTTSAYLEPSAVTDWGAVIAVEISLLARSSSSEPGFETRETFTMGGDTVKIKRDGIRRQVFTSVVYLRN